LNGKRYEVFSSEQRLDNFVIAAKRQMRPTHTVEVMMACAVFFLALAVAQPLRADVLAEGRASGRTPERCGLGMTYGNTYKPGTDIQGVEVSGFMLIDPSTVWPHIGLDSLRYKVGCNAGLMVSPRVRGIVSAGLILVYYLGDFGDHHFRPFVQGGCHIIYDDFQVPGQGLRVNFNPQGGVGAQFDVFSGRTFYTVFSVKHISNGSIRPENAGINAVAFTIGRLF